MIMSICAVIARPGEAWYAPESTGVSILARACHRAQARPTACLVMIEGKEETPRSHHAIKRKRMS